MRLVKKFKRYFSSQKELQPFNLTPSASVKSAQFKHSGNLGDIIFSCALLKAFWEQTGKKVDLHLHTDVPFDYDVDHPMKNVLMNSKVACQLISVLQKQPYIAHVSFGKNFPDEAINLDLFRSLPIDHRTGLIQGWYQLCTDLWLNLFDPWINANNLPEYSDKIVVSRTLRLRSSYIHYKFLAEYAQYLLFIGLPEECSQFQRETGVNCQYLTVDDFGHLTDIINSCRLFIGNQGFLYSIAESVKCPRVLESNSLAPNNYPLSPNGRIAIFQNQFESFVKSMLRNSNSS